MWISHKGNICKHRCQKGNKSSKQNRGEESKVNKGWRSDGTCARKVKILDVGSNTIGNLGMVLRLYNKSFQNIKSKKSKTNFKNKLQQIRSNRPFQTKPLSVPVTPFPGCPWPLLSWTSIVAPDFSSADTVETRPLNAAAWSGVRPGPRRG